MLIVKQQDWAETENCNCNNSIVDSRQVSLLRVDSCCELLIYAFFDCYFTHVTVKKKKKKHVWYNTISSVSNLNQEKLQ